MNHKLDSNKLNKLITYANSLIKLLYFLLVFGIVLVIIILLKMTNIYEVICGILSVLVPVFIGFIISWLFYPLVRKIEDKKVPRLASILIVYVLILLSLFIFFRVFIPVLYDQINDLIEFFPNIINSINSFINKISNKLLSKGLDISEFKDHFTNGMNQYSSSIAGNIPKYIISFTKICLSTIGIFSMGLVIGIYFLIDYEKLYDKCFCLLPKKYCKDVKDLSVNIAEEVRKTVNSTLLVALMVLVLDSILFIIIGLESPLLFGVLCGITDLIPFIGPYIGGAAATVVAFTESSTVGVGVLISCVVVQLLENYVLQPVVMSKATKVNPILVIIFLLIFGHIFGIVGMILATPSLAIIKTVYDFWCNKKKSI